MRKLYEQFPDEEALAKVLLAKLYKKGDWSTDLGIIEELENKLNIGAGGKNNGVGVVNLEMRSMFLVLCFRMRM